MYDVSDRKLLTSRSIVDESLEQYRCAPAPRVQQVSHAPPHKSSRRSPIEPKQSAVQSSESLSTNPARTRHIVAPLPTEAHPDLRSVVAVREAKTLHEERNGHAAKTRRPAPPLSRVESKPASNGHFEPATRIRVTTNSRMSIPVRTGLRSSP